MQEFFKLLQGLNTIFIIILIVLMVLVFMLMSQMNRKISRMNRRYNKLLRGRGELDMEGLVSAHSRDIDLQANRLLDLSKDIEKKEANILEGLKKMDERTNNSIQNIGLHKYNAFEYSSNELSFSLALLDEDYTGIIITSIYGRDNSTVYGKEVVEGQALQSISIEEEIALGRALQTN